MMPEGASEKQGAADAPAASDSQRVLHPSDSTAGAAAPLHSNTLQGPQEVAEDKVLLAEKADSTAAAAAPLHSKTQQVQPEAAEDKVPLSEKADVQSPPGKACSSGRAEEETTEEGQGKVQAEKNKESRDHDQEKVHESDQHKDDIPPSASVQGYVPPLEPEDEQVCLKRPASAELAGQASTRARSSMSLGDAPEENLDEQNDSAMLEPAEEDMVDAEAEDAVEDTRGPIWAGRVCPIKPFWRQMFLMKKAVYEETVAKLQHEFGGKVAQRWKTNAAQRDFAQRLSEELRQRGKSMGTLHDQDIQRSTEFVRVVADRWGEEKAEQFREEMGDKTFEALQLIGM
jgi:hypothetical protein